MLCLGRLSQCSIYSPSRNGLFRRCRRCAGLGDAHLLECKLRFSNPARLSLDEIASFLDGHYLGQAQRGLAGTGPRPSDHLRHPWGGKQAQL